MDKKTFINLFFILILGFVLRFAYIDYNPPSLNWDEVSHGYNAYSIYKTGMDQWGYMLPLLNFRAYGDYPTTLNLYLTMPFIVIFGLTEFAIRFPHVILGTLTIISVYFLTFGITKRKDIGLFSGFLVAISPWYLFTSRFVLQSNLSVFLLISSTALFVYREKSKYFLPLSFVLLTLTLFSYHTTRIFSPLFLVGTLIIYKNEIKNKSIYIFSAMFILISILILINPQARERSKYVGILDAGGINKIEVLQNKYGRLVANKLTYFTSEFGKNYISYFSPKFLFINGGTQYQFSLPNYGLSYLVLLPFFYIGLLMLIKRSFKEKEFRMLLLWLILSPIPASLTNESYTVLRATTILPLPEILATLGLFSIVNWLNENSLKNVNWKLLIPAVTILLLFSLQIYLTEYFTNYRKNYSWSWQYGYKEAVNYIKDNYDNYDKIIITKKYGEPHEFLLFYLKYDPQKYLTDESKIAFQKSNWWWVDRFDKFYFVNDWQVKLNPPEISSIQQYFVTESGNKVDCVNKKCLLVTSPDNYPPGWLELDTINFLDGNPAFEIYNNE